MKRCSCLLLCLLAVLALAACGNEAPSPDAEPLEQTVPSEQTAPNEPLPDQAADDSDETATPKLRLSFEGGEAIIALEDNPTTADLLSLLPLELRFEDFNGTEKISYPPRDLTTEGTAAGHAPAAGDLTLYAPWGNLAIFYRGYSYSDDLLSLGHLESGLNELAAMSGTFSATLELIDE